MGFWKSIKKWWQSEDTSGATEAFNLLFAAFAALLWLVGIIIISCCSGLTKPCISIFGRLLFFSATAFLVGNIIGFFFGIPKTLQRSSAAGQDKDATKGLLDDQLITNTNLEQISDWLTKIIVGLGLVNFKKIPVYLGELRTYFIHAFAGADESLSYSVLAIVIYAAICGFIFMYIYTRVNISSLFLKNSIDEKQLLNDLAKKLQEKGNEEVKKNFINKLNS